MIKYKLTDQNRKTYNGFQWEIGKTVKTSGKGELCGEGWLHYYHHPLLAVFLNPIHANVSHPLLWEVECGGYHKNDEGLKGGCTEMSLLKQITLPSVTLNQRIVFGILCAKKAFNTPSFNKWADNWLSGIDRTEATAWAAEAAACAAWPSTLTAIAASRAAEAAARAAGKPTMPATIPTMTASAAERAAETANWNESILIELAKEALKYE